jgi:hypothetical protein
VVGQTAHRAGHRERDRHAVARGAPPRLHREAATFADDDGCTVEQRGHRRRLERRRHDDDAQVGAEHRTRLEREREPEIGGEMPLVELVEQHRGDALESGVVLHHPREDPFGDDLDARARPDARFVAHAIPDRLARLLAEQARHLRRGGARGDPSRFEHEDPPARDPGLVEQRERHARRLARARRRDEHRARRVAERGEERGERLVDRQRWRAAERRHGRAGERGSEAATEPPERVSRTNRRLAPIT